MKSSKKHEFVYLKLKQVISDLASGAKIPSVRALMKTYNLSQSPVVRALNRLKEEDILKSQHGSGTYLNPEFALSKKIDNKKIIRGALILSSFPSSFFSHIYLALDKEFREKGHLLQVIHHPWYDRFRRTSISGDFDILIFLLSQSHMQDISFIYSLEKLGKPYILIDINSGYLNLNTVCTDNELGGRLAAKHLAELNHQQMAIFCSEKESPNDIARIEGFRTYCDLTNLPEPLLIKCKTKLGESSLINSHKFFLKYCSSEKINFTALFSTNLNGAIAALKAFPLKGINVPKDLSIIGFGDDEVTDFLPSSLTRVAHNFQEIAGKTLNMVKGIIDNSLSSGQSITVAPILKVRESTSSCLQKRQA